MNSLFGQQPANNATNSPSFKLGSTPSSQPASTGGGLFGGGASTTNTNTGGGLFGNNAANTNTSQAPASGGLFGSLGLGASTATSQPQQAGGLFGASMTTSQPQQTGGLFGASTATSQAQPTGGLFSRISQPTTQPTTTAGGLFGASTAATQPATTGGLFGTLGAAKPQTSSLFGGSTLAGGSSATPQQSQAPAQNSLFGAPQAQPQSSLFGAPQQPAQQQQQGQQGQSQQQAPSAAYFDSLLERSKRRGYGETTLEDLPSLQLGLGDIRQRIKRLGPSSRQAETDGRAHYLLAASGVDPGAAVRDLGYLDSQIARSTAREVTAPQADTDVESYLAGLQTQTTLSMIADGLARSVRDFDAFLEENVSAEWDAQRRRIYEHFGIKPREEQRRLGDSQATITGSVRGGFGRSRRSKFQSGNTGRASESVLQEHLESGLQRSIIGSPGPMAAGKRSVFSDVEKRVESITNGALITPEDRLVREKQNRFAKKVQALNNARLEKQCVPVLEEFSRAEAESGDQHVEYVVNAYKAMIEMVAEEPMVRNPADPKAVKERQFADAYLDETPNSPKSTQIRKMILAGANRFLEKQFSNEMEVLISKNPREANLGGVPSVVSKVRAYIRIRISRRDLLPNMKLDQLQDMGEDYVWPLIFYLLRSGHLREAAEFVTSNVVAFRSIDRNFVTYITNYYENEDRRLRRDLQDRINNEYTQRIRHAPEGSIDPFKMACYKVIGRCEVTKRSFDGLNQSMDDYIWLQFNLAREVNRRDEIAGETYGLAEVQSTFQQIGERHFSKGQTDQSFGVFFYLQVLCGLFEQAIEYLYAFQEVDAVHFAIALAFYGLLRVSDPTNSENNLLSFSTRGQAQINFGRMIGHYTLGFRAASPTAAVDYLTLICLNSDIPGRAGQQQTLICHQALRELVLESREFALLLGDIRTDGQRVRGVIEKRMALIHLEDTEDFMKTVTVQAAGVADDNGRITDAVLLYHLAGEYDHVVEIISRVLSEAVAVEIGHGPLHLTPSKPAADAQKSSSLSLTAVDDPVVLARNMIGLYNQHRIYYDSIRQLNRDACGVLMNMIEVKQRIEAQEWMRALDIIEELDILPLRAGGDSNLIRNAANKFAALPQPVLRNVPNLMLWTILCCNRQNEILASRQFGGNEGTRQRMREGLVQKARDLTMYSGLLKYRLPASVNEALARAAAE